MFGSRRWWNVREAIEEEDGYPNQCAKDRGWNDGPVGLRRIFRAPRQQL
jgi:hypothetical protein